MHLMALISGVAARRKLGCGQTAASVQKHLYYLCIALAIHLSLSRGEISVPAYTMQD